MMYIVVFWFRSRGIRQLFAKFPTTYTVFSVRVERENMCSVYVRTFCNYTQESERLLLHQ